MNIRARTLLTRSLPALSGGSLAALKWLALALMTVDHVEAFWLQRSFDSQLGRLVFPIFGFVLAYNLARPTMDGAGRVRLLRRLLLFGLLALPFHAALASQLGGWWPLNVMLTFAVVVGVVHLLEAREFVAAGLLLFVGGALVEYAWPGVLLCLAVWWCYRSHAPAFVAGPLVVLAFAGLGVVNGTQTALLSLPLLWVASRSSSPRLPRLRWAFYAYYPAHLALFWLAGAPGL